MALAEATTAAGPPPVSRGPTIGYVSDAEPGLRRRRSGRGFVYLDVDGSRITDPARLAWIRSLVLPPAWEQVWISPDPNGHLLATGRDQRRRKQYFYHPAWRAEREALKFDRLIAFAEALPRIRATVEADLAAGGLVRRRVLALVVRLLELTLIRIGNPEYLALNGSVGLTTLRARHLSIERGTLRFQFRGKAGKIQDVSVRSRSLTPLVRRLQDLPGQELFKYRIGRDELQPVGSEEVNLYLREAAELDVTAKDFRTWGGTVLAAEWLARVEPPASATAAKKSIAASIRATAAKLGNTPAICRKSYVHPAVLDAFAAGRLRLALDGPAEPGSRADALATGLSVSERAVLAFLRAERGDVPVG